VTERDWKETEQTILELDADDIYYRELNEQIYQAVQQGVTHIILRNVKGQRYIGGNLSTAIKMDIYGTPGQDLASFMRGPLLTVYGNAQDCVGNTMDDGKIIIRGRAGDVLGYGMRGGRIYVGGDVGYRVGIHMKQYEEKIPVIIVGGTAGDFLGEYMAGGVIIVLGMMKEKNGRPLTGNFLGTGMHGGAIYVRSQVELYQLGKGLSPHKLEPGDLEILRYYLEDFGKHMHLSLASMLDKEFTKIMPYTHRPYGSMYAY
jgi:glutamate synthase domain-containing protein 3